MTFGLTPTGFVPMTVADIVPVISADLWANVRADLDLDPDQPFGQIVGICAQREATLWELVQTLCNQFKPGAAQAFLADNIGALTGVLRLPATKSYVTQTCNLNAGFTCAPGAMMANVNGQPNTRFTNKAAVGPVGATGNYSIVFQCTDVGPVAANAGTLNVITAPVSGWNSTTNALDAVRGTLIETDAAYELRRQAELAKPGSCTAPGMRADVLSVTGVQQCFVFENKGLTTDGNGLAGKATEVVIFDGIVPAADNTAVATAVFGSKPSGAQLQSLANTTTVNIVDATGETQVVPFSRATVLPVYLTFDVTVDASIFPSDGATQIANAVAAWGASKLNLGVDVVSVQAKAAALITGVLDVPNLALDVVVSPVSTANIVVTGRQIASLDTSRIIVNVTTGTP